MVRTWIGCESKLTGAPGDDGFDFRIVESPELLHELILDKVTDGVTARMIAGFCWPWSGPLGDGTLVPDVKVGSWRMPWNAKSGAGIP